MRKAFALLFALMSLAVSGGCGGDSDDSGSKPASNEPNGIESKSPQRALRETAAALRRVTSFHIEATEGRSTRAVGDVAVPGRLQLDLKQRESTAQMVFLDGAVYINGNTAFWKGVDAGGNAKELDGRWLKVPGAQGGLQELVRQIDPANLSHCLLKEHGTLTSGGTATVDGQRAFVLIDKGDRPGTAPGRLYVAATGEPLPLRSIATGRERPGGKKDPLCDSDGETPTQAGDEVLFSHYNEPVNITAPPDALDLAQPGGGAQS